jgi:hypothetical protein
LDIPEQIVEHAYIEIDAIMVLVSSIKLRRKLFYSLLPSAAVVADQVNVP